MTSSVAALGCAEDLRISDKAHVGGNVVITDFFCAHTSHGACTVTDEDAVPSPAVGVSQCPEQALVGIDSCEKERLLPAFTQPLVHRQLRAPESAHARFVEAHIVFRDVLLQRVVDVCVPCTGEQAAFTTLLRRQSGAETDMPSTAFLVSSVPIEAASDGRRHDLQVVVGDTPVQPAHLYALFPALLEDSDERLDGRDALVVVVEVWVDEVVLHVDDDEQSALRVDQDPTVVADAIVGVESDLALAAARQVEALGLWVVEPLVVTACVVGQ